MISLSFDQSDLARITQKLHNVRTNSEPTSGKLLFVVRHVAQEYADSLLKVIGSVDAGDPWTGPLAGNFTLNFEGASMSSTWQPLARYTLVKKMLDGQLVNGKMAFWYATGDTKRGIKVHDPIFDPRILSVFSGITASDPGFDNALRTEFGAEGPAGKQFPARALFTIANELVNRSEVRDKIVAAVRKSLMDGVNWGAS